MRELPQYPHPTWPDTIPLVARVGPPDIIGMIERGSESDINPSARAARGIGGTASRAMLIDLAYRVSSKDPDAIIGAQSGNAATNMLNDLGKRVEAGEAGALAAPITSESLEMLNNLNGRVEERGGQAGE